MSENTAREFEAIAGGAPTSAEMKLIEEYQREGLHMLRVKKASKKPVGQAWTTLPRLTTEQARKWVGAGENIGVLLGRNNTYAIDVDGFGIENFFNLNPKLRQRVRWRQGHPGRGTLLVRGAGWGRWAGAGNKELDILGAGHHCVVPPSIHPDTGQRYTWQGDAGLPMVLECEPDEIKFPTGVTPKAGEQQPSGGTRSDGSLVSRQIEKLRGIGVEVVGAEGDEITFRCPKHPPDTEPSGRFNARTEKFNCLHRTGDERLKGMGMADLEQKLHEITQGGAAASEKGGGNEGAGGAATTNATSPPTPPPPLGETIRAIEALIMRFVYFTNPGTALLIATWIVGTYTFRCFSHFGYLWVTSAEKRSGKTTLLDLLHHLCANATGIQTATTPANLFRQADQGKTLILDEVENLRNGDKEAHGAIIQVLNSGFRQGGTVPRSEKVKTKSREDYEPKEYQTYCPKAFAGINSVIGTLEDRSFKILMCRKPQVSTGTERFRPQKLKAEFSKLRSQAKQWVEGNKSSIEATDSDTDMLDRISALRGPDDRFKDIAEPLYILAYLADKETVERRAARKPPPAPEKEEALLGALGFPSPEVQRLVDALGEAEKAGELVLTRLAGVLQRMAQERVENEEDSENQEPIRAFLPWLEERLGKSAGSRVFVPTNDFMQAKDADGEPIWGVNRGGSKALASYLKKLGLSPVKDAKGKRGYWVDQSWLDGQKATYGITAFGPGACPQMASYPSNVSRGQQNQALTQDSGILPPDEIVQ